MVTHDAVRQTVGSHTFVYFAHCHPPSLEVIVCYDEATCNPKLQH